MTKIEGISGLSPHRGGCSASSARRQWAFAATALVGFFFLAAMSVSASPEPSPTSGNAGVPEAASAGSVAESSPGKAIRNSRPNYTRESVAYSVPDIDLTAHDGTRVGLVSALGEDQSVMVNFVFTSCTTICPVLSASFAAVSRQLAEAGEEVEFLSISIDPEYDSQEKLAEYAEKVGAGGDWLFLTGSRDDILDLQAAFNTYRGNKMNHLPLTFLKRAGARKWTRIEGFPSVQEILVEYRNAETL